MSPTPRALSVAFAAALLSAAASLGGALTPTSALVGDLGDPQRLVFQGNAAFTAQALRSGLSSDLDYVLASHSCATRAEFLKTLRAKLLEGYRHCGFPDTRLSLGVDLSRGGPGPQVTAKIVEGPRYVNGEVEVVGARAVPAERLAKWLTASRKPSAYAAARHGQSPPIGSLPGFQQPEPIPPSWEPGKPTAFDQAARTRTAASVRRAYAELGRFFPKLAVRIVPEKGKPTARLVVEVEDEGPPGTIGDIQVAGAKRNSRASILQCLQVAPGDRVDQHVVERLQHALWRSGRFASAAVTLEPPKDKGGKQTLLIRVREHAKAPPLPAKLSPAQQALLRVRDWLAAFPHGQDEAVLTYSGSGMSVEAVFSPQQGVLARVRRAGKDGGPADGWGALITGDRIGFLARAGGGKSLLARHRVGLIAHVAFRLMPDSPDGRELAFRFGLGVTSQQPKNQPTRLRAEFRLAPAAFLALTSHPGCTCTVEQGVLTVASDFGLMKADARSGRILELRSAAPPPAPQLHVRFQKGTFAEQAKALGLGTAAEATPTDVWTAIVERACSTALMAADVKLAQRRRAIATLRSLIRLALTLVQGIFPDAPGDTEARFELPFASPRTQGDMVAVAVAKVLLPWASRAFPRNSWPWTTVREAALVAGGKGKYTGRELERLYRSSDTGPVGCLIIASLLKRIKQPRLARLFAAKGLRTLSLEAFLADCRLFVQGGHEVARTLRKGVDILCALEPRDVAAAAAVLPSAELLALLRQERKGKPADQALLSVLERAWHTFLEAELRQALERLAAE